jgi:hypothetical protein
MSKVIEDKIIQFEKLKTTLKKENSPVIRAMIEDEAARLASQKRSKEYIDMIEKERNHMPEWIWNLLFFLLGFLIALSEPGIFQMIWSGLK